METNYTNTQSKRTIVFVLLLAFLIHLLLMMALLIWKYHDKEYELKLQELREQLIEKLQQQKMNAAHPEDETFEWVAGQAKGGGATVVFDDTQAPSLGAEPQEQQPLVDQQVADIAPPLDQQKAEEMEETEEKPADLPLKEEITPKTPTTTLTELGETKPMEQAPEEIKGATHETHKVETPETKPKKKRKKIANAQQKVSLAAIAQGYMQKINQNSEHFVNTLSNKQGTPTDEQIKYERYIAKLFACMQKSIKVHKNNINIPNTVQAYVAFNLTLTRSGTIEDLYILQSSGMREVDDFILFIVRDAACSFPPVPSYLKQTAYPLAFIINQQPEAPLFRFSL